MQRLHLCYTREQSMNLQKNGSGYLAGYKLYSVNTGAATVYGSFADGIAISAIPNTSGGGGGSNLMNRTSDGARTYNYTDGMGYGAGGGGTNMIESWGDAAAGGGGYAGTYKEGSAQAWR